MSRMIINDTEIQNADIFEIILDNFPDIIHSIDDNGNIVFTNHAAELMLGYSRSELYGMNIRQIYAPEILEAMEKGFSDLKQRGDKRVESMLMTKNGERIPVEIRSFGIYDDHGNFLRTFSILRDIRKIKELEDGLIHASRLAAIGELASGVAHDINNPLTIVLLSTELLLRSLGEIQEDQDDKADKAIKLANDVQKAAGSIQKLADHLRNFSRGMAEDIEPVDLGAVISDALFITASKIKKSMTSVSCEIERDKYRIMGSPNRLEQVFVNLIANACDAMEGREQRELSISLDSANLEDVDCWACRISDTGPGIPEENIEEIFRSFFTTKPKGKGTGLGLSISRGIVRDQRGDIVVDSKPDAGTTFTVLLPKI